MHHYDMRLPQPRCQPSCSVTCSTCMQEGDLFHHHGKYAFDNGPRTPYNSAARKEKANSIFSFLQRFRAKTKNAVEDVSSLPSSPRSSRFRFGRGPGAGCRWESVESVLSSATASSFAFIPPYQCRNVQRPRHLSSSNPQRPISHERNSTAGGDSPLARDNSAFLRRKYNLLGSNATLCRNVDDANEAKKLKKLHRNSVGDVDTLKRQWSVREFASFRRPAKPPAEPLNRRPKSEYNVRDPDPLARKLPHCHKPGKRRAPQPPAKTPPDSACRTPAKVAHSRKKRKAPSPPTNHHLRGACKPAAAAAVMTGDKEEYAVCNDSLKLEKGVLKANKTSTLTATTAAAAETASVAVPVSPKPWYKRSATRGHSKSIKSLDKKKSCEQLLDEWMLEAGLPRPSALREERKSAAVSPSPAADHSGKRRSQLSMLANISELDREAAEIVKNERNRERAATDSMNDKFYVRAAFEPHPHVGHRSSGVDEPSTSKRHHTSKDLISILNAITNVTKITVNTSFFKEHAAAARVVATKDAVNVDVQGGQGGKAPPPAPQPVEQRKSKLTITELEDFDDENAAVEEERSSEKPAAAAAAAVEEEAEAEAKKEVAKMVKEATVKPVKPFSSWMCPQCTLENPSWKFICEACNKWRPYSVNKASARTTTAAVGRVQDAKPKLEMVGGGGGGDRRSSLAEEREIDNISKNIRRQVYDMLTSAEGVRNASDVRSSNAGAPEANASSRPREKSAIEKIDENIEEIRKARLAFFGKNCLNDLNVSRAADSAAGDHASSDDAKPMNVNRADDDARRNKYYNEEDRRKLREILKELKNSLPKHNVDRDRTSGEIVPHSRTNARPSNVAKTVEKEQKESKNTRTDDDDDQKFADTATSQQKFAKQANRGGDVNAIALAEIKIPVIDDVCRTWAASGEIAKINLKPSSPATRPREKGAANTSATSEAKTEIGLRSEATDLSKSVSEMRQFSDHKNGVANTKENKCVTSLAVNRLLKKLQTAIASGQHHEAANIARDLARLKVNCNVTRQDIADNILPFTSEPLPLISLNVHIKGGTTNQDPFSIKIGPSSTINELQSRISNEYNIPVQNQRLMYRRRLIINDTVTLDQLGINASGSTIFLHLTPSENQNASSNFEDKFQMGAHYVGNKILEKPLNIEVDRSINNENCNVNNTHATNDAAVNAQNVIVATAGSSNENIIENAKGMDVNIETEQKPTTTNAENINLTAKQLPSNEEKLDNIAEWECPRCTLMNEHFANNCVVCGRRRNENKIVVEQKAESSHGLNSNIEQKSPEPKLTNYQELMDLEKTDLITNVAQFDCPVCLSAYRSGEGVILKECLHTFCRQCLSQTIEHSGEAEVKCPYRDADYSCDSVLQEREIKALVSPLIFEKHLARSVSEAENNIENAFHCKTADCRGWCIFEDNVNEFHCPVCSKTNCLTCQAIHTGLNCKQYQEVINKESETNADANGTRLMLQEMLQKGEAMTCPTCQVILMKKWGCDWLRCSMCKTEICWVTRGPRWGPKGKGDTSGGCRCGVNGSKCHQRCTFCH